MPIVPLMQSRSESRFHPSEKVVHIHDDTKRASLPDERLPTIRLGEFANLAHFRIYPYTIPKRFHP
jgi:hypothetical protein